jgi:aspartate/tyrosine/aromatic aminotransferase
MEASFANNLLFRLVFAGRVAELILGQPKSQWMTGIQRTGGTGAFRILAGLIVRAKGDVTVWLSELTWLNHSTIFADAGLRTATHPYCDCRTSQVRVDEMLAALEAIPSGEVVLFHGCCHNPCGADLSLEAWDAIAAIMSRRGLIPLVVLAYQGFGRGLDEDAAGVRLLPNKRRDFFSEEPGDGDDA